MNLFSHLLLFLTFNSFVFAQEQEDGLNNGMGIGFNVTQIQRDFGLGLNIVSPYFFRKKMAIRIRTNIVFNENNPDSLVRWAAYSNFSLGIIGVGGMLSERIRLYGEGGVFCLLPSKDLSDNDLEMGGYGLLGFEFFAGKGFNFYIEIGGVGTGARAERIISKPIYSNGFLIGAGFRVFLK